MDDRFALNKKPIYSTAEGLYRSEGSSPSFQNFRVVPPGTGIYAYPDTLVGTYSHTTMINGLGILAWGVGGIKAVDYAALHPDEGLFMALALTVPQILARTGLHLRDMDLIEIHEAFGAQVAANVKAWEKGWKGDPLSI